MSKIRKTREEKVKSAYRLQNFKLKVEERMVAKDTSEFGYLSSEYVVKDLIRTGAFTLFMLLLLFLAVRYLG